MQGDFDVYDFPELEEGLQWVTTNIKTQGKVNIIDIKPPSLPTNFEVYDGDNEIQLYWTNPTESDFKEIMIRKDQTSVPLTISSGNLVVKDNITLFLDESVENTTSYNYTIFAGDDVGNWTEGVTANAYAKPLVIKTVKGDYTLPANKTLTIELGGTSNETVIEYDRLDVSEGLTIDGDLKIELVNEFEPVLGDTFDIIDAQTISGTFDSIDLPTLEDESLKWATGNIYITGVIDVADRFNFKFTGIIDYDRSYSLDNNTGVNFTGKDTVIGLDGNGYLTLEEGGFLINKESTIASKADSLGKVTLKGPNSQWINEGSLVIANEGTGTLLQEDGLVKIGDTFSLGVSANSEANYTMLKGNMITKEMIIGDKGKATVKQENGKVSITGNMELAIEEPANTTYTGNEVKLTGTTLYVGRKGKATMTLTDSDVTFNNKVMIAEENTSQSKLIFKNGKFVTNELIVGEEGKGELKHTNATSNVYTTVIIGNEGEGKYTGKEVNFYADSLKVGKTEKGTMTHDKGFSYIFSEVMIGENAEGSYTGEELSYFSEDITIGKGGEGEMTFEDSFITVSGNINLAKETDSSGSLELVNSVLEVNDITIAREW